MSGEAQKPIRIQRHRTRGWRMPVGAIYVGRPSRWGNPFRPCEPFSADEVRAPALTQADCVELFRQSWNRMLNGSERHRATALDNLAELRGRNLACWCALDAPCHADVLLELANRPEAR